MELAPRSATTQRDGQLLIPNELFDLMLDRMAKYEKVFASIEGGDYHAETIRQLPFMLKSAERRSYGHVLVSTAARLYLARCMHDFMPTLLLLRDEHHQRSLRELGKLLGVPRVGELIPTREQLVEEEQSRWNLLKVRELP